MASVRLFGICLSISRLFVASWFVRLKFACFRFGSFDVCFTLARLVLVRLFAYLAFVCCTLVDSFGVGSFVRHLFVYLAFVCCKLVRSFEVCLLQVWFVWRSLCECVYRAMCNGCVSMCIGACAMDV